MDTTLRRIGEQVMRSSRNQVFKAFAFLLLTVVMIMLTYFPTEATAASATLKFESQALDLDTGRVVDWGLNVLPRSETADVYIACNSDRLPHAVVVLAGRGSEVAVAQGLAFDMITAQVVSSLTFSGSAPDVPFTQADTVVVKAAGGAVYKLGRPSEEADSVSFEYALMFIQ